MSATILYPALAYSRVDGIEPGEVESLVAARAGRCPQLAIDFEPGSGILWLTLRPEPKPVFTLPLVESVRRVQIAVADLHAGRRDWPVRYIGYRAAGDAFSLGGDLDFYLECLARGDRGALEEYARTAAEVIVNNMTGVDGHVITLACVHAKALGGGIDPAVACNYVVAERSATFSYPEVNFNHFPIAAVPVLARRAGLIEAEKILSSGEVFSADDFLAKGVIDYVAEPGSGQSALRDYAQRSGRSHSARIALFRAFQRTSGDVGRQMKEACDAWVDHMTRLRPAEIAKLQRIAAAQERMLARGSAR